MMLVVIQYLITRHDITHGIIFLELDGKRQWNKQADHFRYFLNNNRLICSLIYEQKFMSSNHGHILFGRRSSVETTWPTIILGENKRQKRFYGKKILVNKGRFKGHTESIISPLSIVNIFTRRGLSILRYPGSVCLYTYVRSESILY